MKTDYEILRELATAEIPWLVHGRELEGMDCMGVVLWFFFSKGYKLPDPASRNPEEVIASDLAKLFTPLQIDPSSRPPTGAIASYSDEEDGKPLDHLGIVFHGQIVQATRNRGVCASEIGFLKPSVYYVLNEEAAEEYRFAK